MICVEVDLVAGLPEAVKITVAAWHHFQKLDYKQLSFKCRNCYEHGHFQRKCPKAQPLENEEGDGWQKVKKVKATPKLREKKKKCPTENPQLIPEVKEAPKEASTSLKSPEVTEVQEKDPKEIENGKLASDPVAPEDAPMEKET